MYADPVRECGHHGATCERCVGEMGEKEKRRKVATAYIRCHFAPVPKSRDVMANLVQQMQQGSLSGVLD